MCSEEIINPMADRLHCRVGWLPFQYLGLPIGANLRSKALWSLVIENFKKKLSSCKRHYTYLGERITLIKATLSNLPVYYMSLFKMP